MFQLMKLESDEEVQKYVDSSLSERFDIGFTKPTSQCGLVNVPLIIQAFVEAELFTPELQQFVEGMIFSLKVMLSLIYEVYNKRSLW